VGGDGDVEEHGWEVRSLQRIDAAVQISRMRRIHAEMLSDLHGAGCQMVPARFSASDSMRTGD